MLHFIGFGLQKRRFGFLVHCIQLVKSGLLFGFFFFGFVGIHGFEKFFLSFGFGQIRQVGTVHGRWWWSRRISRRLKVAATQNTSKKQKTKRVRSNKSIDWYDIEEHDSGSTYGWWACR